MKIIPLAAESLGSRSMATFVETNDCRILIDPGANICPLRYGLKPHSLENWFLEKHRERIQLFTKSAEVIIISHYHFDHFTPDIPDLYKNKILFLKNPNQNINVNQRNRAFELLKKIQGLPKEINYVDGRTHSIGKTKFIFSPPVFHGAANKMGFIIQIALHESENTFIFSSDIQGPSREDQLDFIVSQNPGLLYIDGPVTYLLQDSSLNDSLKKTVERMEIIVKKTNVRKIIIDHHLLRDLNWKKKIDSFLKFAREREVIVQTAAEFRGEENNVLEARRKQLYENDLPKKVS